jgi:hypothetical protein
MTKDVLNRKTAFATAMISLILWMALGFDSTPLQFIHVLYEGVPNLILGKASFNDLHVIYDSYYGREMHYSAFVIYGLMYWALSRHFNKNLGITKSKNIAYSVSLTFLSIAIFEFFWMYSYATFQHQAWVITPKWPQLRIQLQNVLFATVGALGVLYMWTDSHVYNKIKKGYDRIFTFRWDLWAICFVLLSVLLAVSWINYTGYVEKISVPLSNGEVWTNTANFPQTLYTVDVNPNDNVNAGEWFYVSNDLIHGLNTLVKVVWTFTILYIGLVKKTV